MTFVPEFEQDVFISYAHVDDEPFFDAAKPDQSAGWVTTFVRLLKNELAEKVGRKEKFTLWFDSVDLRGNHALAPEIKKKLEHTANFVAILSPSYLASQWCHDEAQLFTQRFASQLEGRVFIVEKAPLDDRAAVLPALTGLRDYRFWYADRNQQPRTFAKPMPQPDEVQYFRLIEDLARDIHQQLKTMAKRQPDAVPRADRVASGDDASSSIAFLAEVTDDLEFCRLEVRRYLEQQGALVLPGTSLPLGRAQFEAALDADLARSRVFVQLLGPMPGKMPPDVPDGYGWLQLECAWRRRLPVLQWRSPELDLTGIEWARHRELLELETVQATSLEAFKRAVVEALAPPPPPQSRPTDNQPLVFLNTEPRHSEIAAKIRESIRDRAALVEPLREGSAEEVRVDFEQNLIDCDAMVVVYTDNVGWARAQLRAFNKQAPRRERRVRAIPVIDAPPDPKPELGFHLPGMVIINSRNGVGSEALAQLSRSLQL
jgi:TIR domain